MTPEFIRMLNRALAVTAIGLGGFGMLCCLPFVAVSGHILWIIGAAIIMLAAAVVFAAGEVTLAIMVTTEQKTGAQK